MGVLSGCDVVITNDNTQYVGLKYYVDFCDAPYVVCKGYELNTYQRKVIEAIGIPCVEDKPLTRSIFENVNEPQQIPRNYWIPVSKIYSNLEKYDKPRKETEFEKQLKEDIVYHVYEHEKNVYKKTLRNFRRRRHSEKKFEGNVTRYFEEEIRNLTAAYEINNRSYHNSVLKTDEFYLEICFDNYDISFLQMIFFVETEQKIYIGSRSFLVSFDYVQAEMAMEFVKLLIRTCNEELINDTRLLCDEYDVNPKEYEIALNSIKTIVELNYKQTGQEYGIFNDTTSVSIFLKKKDASFDEKSRMYIVVITYKEYLRNAAVFKEFIKNPKPQKQWNFWCRERKYNKKYFDKKFQNITT